MILGGRRRQCFQSDRSTKDQARVTGGNSSVQINVASSEFQRILRVYLQPNGTAKGEPGVRRSHISIRFHVARQIEERGNCFCFHFPTHRTGINIFSPVQIRRRNGGCQREHVFMIDGKRCIFVPDLNSSPLIYRSVVFDSLYADAPEESAFFNGYCRLRDHHGLRAAAMAERPLTDLFNALRELDLPRAIAVIKRKRFNCGNSRRNAYGFKRTAVNCSYKKLLRRRK